MLDLLDGVRVLDLCDDRGEVASWLLGRLGASVVKVEAPGGCPSRTTVGEATDSAGQSLRFNAYNHDKASIVLDPDHPGDREVLDQLVAAADIIFDSGSAVAADRVEGRLALFGYDTGRISDLARPTVYALITPFGRTGPRAGQPASELSIAALGGPIRLQGAKDRPPVTVSVPQVWRHTGAEAAVAALVARARGLAQGSSQILDVSAQSVMTWTLLNAMEAHQIQGRDFERCGATLELAMTVNLRHPASDGWVILVPHSRSLGALVPVMIADDIVDESWLTEDWDSWDQRVIDGEPCLVEPDDVDEAVDRWCVLRTKAELLDLGRDIGVTIAPINTLADLIGFDHLEERGFWDDHEGHRRPGGFITVDGSRGRPAGRVPSVDEHGVTIRRGEVWPLDPVVADTVQGPDVNLPFAGLKVADFSWIGVGPITTKCLADHGATVVRVESANRIDGLRVQPPFTDGSFGINRSNFYGSFNTSKLGVAADLKTESGLDAAKALVAWADVVIDSFTPGAMARLGLGPDDVADINPSAITVTTSLLGGGGHRSSMAGFGYHAAALAGFFELVGYPDGPPEGPYLAYTDTIGPRFITPTLLAALERRSRTGAGCHIEAAQLEIALQFLAPELADYDQNAVVVGRQGNRDPRYAPQGVYPCSGDDTWVAITVGDDKDWQALVALTGNPDWAADPALATLDGRLAHHDLIDDALSKWTAGQTETDAEELLRQAGLSAGRVARSRDLAIDPQYRHRCFYQVCEHTECGPTPYAGHQYRIEGYTLDEAATPHGPRSAAPCLGEHTFEVLTEEVGLDAERVAELAAGGGLE